ncbi:MAG: DUF1566 domain-containing protein, partial [Rhodoferax sp.]|nr:DUF1566 domain-containing protein [Rhodoferax sp.]
YVAGYPFSVNSSGKVVKDKNARLYKISTDFATATPLTQNNESVTFFALFPSGEPVVALKKGADLASMELALYRNGTQRISLATSIVDPFVNTDSYRTLLYGSAQGTKGINLVRTNPLGVDSANFDYNSGKGSNYNRQVEGKTYTDLVPRRIILSEEGNFYSVYSATEQGGNNVLLVYQTLPFDRNAKAVIPVGGVASWWAEMKNRPIQIRNGILYYAKSEVRPNIGNVDVIQVVRLSDGVKQKLFGDKSYRIDSWQAVGDKLFFSGIDNATNKLVQGSVSSTQFAASGADWSDEAWSAYTNVDVKVTPTASAKEASIQIQDMENLTPVQPLVDPGNPAAILKFESTEKSALFSFNKYMKTDTVETVLSLRPQKAGVNAPTFFPVWGYQKLHLVYDSSDGGLSLPDTEGLRSTDGRFDFVASNNLPDAYNNQSIPSQDITGNSLYTVAAIAIDTQPLSQTVTYGDAVTFSVVANGNGTLTYQWIKNGWLTIPGATSSTYTILSTNNANNGERYSVEVSNDVGKVASSDATLMVTRYSLVAKASGGFYDKTECVKDLSTGLIWEGKNPIGSSSRPADGTYTNYDSSHTGGTNINDSANSIGYVNSVNALSLCGFTDWRLPTDGEQSNIMITGWGTPEPKIDTTWFPNAQGTQYWTSTRIYGNDWLLWINDFKNHQITSDLREPYKKLALRLVHAPSPSQ